MAFAQLTYRESLREIETCLRALQPKLYHAGIRSKVARSTLAEANENRDWRVYADFAQVLIQRARNLYAEDEFGVVLDQATYVFDSTTIDLCLSLFPWAHFRRRKGAIKLHTLMDLHGSIPCFIRITEGNIHDVNLLDQLILEPGSFYILDRGYIDFARLYAFHQGAAYFVIRAKKALDYARRCSVEVDKTTGVRADQKIVLCGPKTARLYPELLRRVSYRAEDPGTHFVFLTNNFMLPALTIANLYKCRWQV
jgi:transposase